MSFQVPENNFDRAEETTSSHAPAPEEKPTSSAFNLYGLFFGHRVQEDRFETKEKNFDFSWSNFFSGIADFFVGNAKGELKPVEETHQDVLARASSASKAIIEEAIEQRFPIEKDKPEFKGKPKETVRAAIKKEIEEAIKKQVALLVKEESWSFGLFFVFASKHDKVLLEDRLLVRVIPALQDPSRRSSNQSIVERYVEERMKLLKSNPSTAEEKKQNQDRIKQEVDLLVRTLAYQEMKKRGDSSYVDAVLPSQEQMSREDIFLQSTLQLEMKAMARMEKLKQKIVELQSFEDRLPFLSSVIQVKACQEYRSLKKKRNDAVTGMTVALERIEEIEKNRLALQQAIQDFSLKPTDSVAVLIKKLENTNQNLLQYIQSMNDPRKSAIRVTDKDTIKQLQEKVEIDFYHTIEAGQISNRAAEIRAISVPLPHEIINITSLLQDAESAKDRLIERQRQYQYDQADFQGSLTQQKASFYDQESVLQETMQEVSSLYRLCGMKHPYSLDALKKEFYERADRISKYLQIGNKESEESLNLRFTIRILEYTSWIKLLEEQVRKANSLFSSVAREEVLSQQDQIILNRADQYSKKLEEYKIAQETKKLEREEALRKQQELEKQKKAVAEQERLKQQKGEGLAEEAAKKVMEENQRRKQSVVSQTLLASSTADPQSTAISKDPSMRVEESGVPVVNVPQNATSPSTQPARRLIPKSVTQYTKRFTKPITGFFKTEFSKPHASSSASLSRMPPVDLKAKIIGADFAGATQTSVSAEQGKPTPVPTTQKYESEDID